jgi:hypothetical protein
MPETQRPASSQTPVLDCADGLVMAEIGALCVAIWRGDASIPRFERQRVALAQVVARHPEGIGLLCVIEPASAAPDDQLRRASVDMVVAHGERIKCVACVIEGKGFRAGLNRGILMGMSLFLPHPKLTYSFFSTVRSAVDWMGRYVPLPSSTDTALEVERARSLLDQEPSP